MPCVGFEHTNPISERVKAVYALDRAATVIGNFSHRSHYIYLTLLDSDKKLWEELITYVSLIRQGSHIKRRLPQFFAAAGTCLLSHCLATIRRYTDLHTLI
jgi:hypothetical protein